MDNCFPQTIIELNFLSYLCHRHLNCRQVEVLSLVPYLDCRSASYPRLSQFEVDCEMT